MKSDWARKKKEQSDTTFIEAVGVVGPIPAGWLGIVLWSGNAASMLH